jgi:hypothetical protein
MADSSIDSFLRQLKLAARRVPLGWRWSPDQRLHHPPTPSIHPAQERSESLEPFSKKLFHGQLCSFKPSLVQSVCQFLSPPSFPQNMLKKQD